MIRIIKRKKMKKADIISFARDQGAQVEIKTLDNSEFISVLVEKSKKDNSTINGWNQGLFIKEINSYWEIGFSHNSKTRLLMDREVTNILEIWCQNPTDELLNKYIEV
jgi:hypothetical protein